LWPDFSCLCGFTWYEIEGTFATELSALGDLSETKTKIIQMYNGYSWSGSPKVCNPHSICSLFGTQDSRSTSQLILKAYWMEGGNTRWFVDMMKQVKGRIPAADVWIDEDALFSRIDFTLNPTDHGFEDQLRALVFQAGYLTIHQTKFLNDIRFFNIRVPNDEVDRCLLPAIWESFVSRQNERLTLSEMNNALNNNNLETFFNILNGKLNHIIPWKTAQNAAKYEGFFQSLLLILLHQIEGLDVSAEVQNISGQLDIRVVTRPFFFVFEIKQCACENKQKVELLLKSAVNQVFDKNYALGDKTTTGCECYAVGLVFCNEKRLAAAFQVQKFAVENHKVVMDGPASHVVYLLQVPEQEDSSSQNADAWQRKVQS
jgi:hypothetical protein